MGLRHGRAFKQLTRDYLLLLLVHDSHHGSQAFTFRSAYELPNTVNGLSRELGLEASLKMNKKGGYDAQGLVHPSEPAQQTDGRLLDGAQVPRALPSIFTRCELAAGFCFLTYG